MKSLLPPPRPRILYIYCVMSFFLLFSTYRTVRIELCRADIILFVDKSSLKILCTPYYVYVSVFLKQLRTSSFYFQGRKGVPFLPLRPSSSLRSRNYCTPTYLDYFITSFSSSILLSVVFPVANILPSFIPRSTTPSLAFTHSLGRLYHAHLLSVAFYTHTFFGCFLFSKRHFLIVFFFPLEILAFAPNTLGSRYISPRIFRGGPENFFYICSLPRLY